MNLPRTMSRSAGCNSSGSLTSGASTLLCLDQLVNLRVVETRFILIQRGMGFLSYSLKYNFLTSLKIRLEKYFEVQILQQALTVRRLPIFLKLFQLFQNRSPFSIHPIMSLKHESVKCTVLVLNPLSPGLVNSFCLRDCPPFTSPLTH